jgi:hypothetical protein
MIYCLLFTGPSFLGVAGVGSITPYLQATRRLDTAQRTI